MTSREFCYWLQGWFELNESLPDSSKIQHNPTLDMIKNHLNLVFYHEIDKTYSEDQKVQQEMNEIHSPEFYPGKPRC